MALWIYQSIYIMFALNKLSFCHERGRSAFLFTNKPSAEY